eukprot:IDg7629t1
MGWRAYLNVVDSEMCSTGFRVWLLVAPNGVVQQLQSEFGFVQKWELLDALQAYIATLEVEITSDLGKNTSGLFTVTFDGIFNIDVQRTLFSRIVEQRLRFYCILHPCARSRAGRLRHRTARSQLQRRACDALFRYRTP